MEDQPIDSAVESNDVSIEDSLAIVYDCLQLFETVDYIMEPEIFAQLRRYITAGGTPEWAIHQLSNNYTGVAQMVNLVGNWLLTIGTDAAELQSMVENVLKNAILKSFDPQKADKLFTQENTPPQWLNNMIEFPTWRSLIYRLTEEHPDCLLLNYALKLISGAGYKHEIASIRIASSYLDLYLPSLQSSIVKYLRQPNASTIEEVAKVVCHRQHTYVFSQVLLQALSEKVEFSPIVKRLSQEITKYAAQNYNQHVVPITMTLNGASRYSEACAALISILSTKALKLSDMLDMYRCYTSLEPPPINLIRNEQFLDLLTSSIFNVNTTLGQEYKSKCIFLLGIAASVCETGTKEGPWLGAVRTSNVDEVKATIQAIETVHEICCTLTTSILPHIATIFQYIKYPVVAIGVLRWAGNIITGASYFELCSDSYPHHLALLDEIARQHMSLHEQILQLLVRLLESKQDQLEVLERLNVKKMLLDRMVHLLAYGGAIPVVRYVSECYARGAMDISLIRYFVKEVLDIIQPPYSLEFVQLFLPMVENVEISGTIDAQDDCDQVSEFIVHCKAWLGK
uniref:TH1 protein n=1 Tax=Anopheles maculatus TaxID=74869 RepID=A0A182T297_9DIPT